MNSHRFAYLTQNSRFWILLVGIALSVVIAGLVQLLVPSGTLQIIRIQQAYGFVSLFLLWLTLLASPLTNYFTQLVFKAGYLHSRRALGVLAFYYSLLHAYLSFSQQLGGVNGIQYYNQTYSVSLLLGCVALVILFAMAVTSTDWAVTLLGTKLWKYLHRLVYVAGVAILVHVFMVGSHFGGFNLLSTTTGAALLSLLYLKLACIWRVKKRGFNNK